MSPPLKYKYPSVDTARIAVAIHGSVAKAAESFDIPDYAFRKHFSNLGIKFNDLIPECNTAFGRRAELQVLEAFGGLADDMNAKTMGHPFDIEDMRIGRINVKASTIQYGRGRNGGLKTKGAFQISGIPPDSCDYILGMFYEDDCETLIGWNIFPPTKKHTAYQFHEDCIHMFNKPEDLTDPDIAKYIRKYSDYRVDYRYHPAYLKN